MNWETITKRKGLTNLAIALATIGWTGISIAPGNPYFLLSTDPTIAHELENTYQSTPLFSIIAWILHIDSPRLFAFYSLTWCLASFGLLYFYLQSRLEWSLPFVFCILLNHPFAYTQLLWLGLADSAHYCFWLLILMINKWLPKVILCILSGANHPASIFVAISFLFYNDRRKDKITLVLSSILGLFLAKCWNQYHEVEIYSRIDYVMDRGIWHPIYNALCNLPILLFSYHNICWILIFLIGFSYIKSGDKKIITIFILHIIGLSTLVATDLTRCFSLIVSPLLFRIITDSELLKKNDPISKKIFLIIAITSFITPAIFVWDTSIWTNMFHLHFSNFWEVVLGMEYYIPYPTGELNIPEN